MLGYRGRSNRRDFVAGAGLLTVGPAAFAMAVQPSIPWVFQTFERNAALGFAFVLTLLVCALVVLWFWGWTVLATRRARDIGWPAWGGVLSIVLLVAVGRSTVDLPAPFAFIAGWGVLLLWAGVFAVWPSARSRPAGEPVPGPA